MLLYNRCSRRPKALSLHMAELGCYTHGHRFVKSNPLHLASTDICERTCRSQELSEFHRGIMTQCHMCNKCSHEIPWIFHSQRLKWYCNKVDRLGRTASVLEAVGHVYNVEARVCSRHPLWIHLSKVSIVYFYFSWFSVLKHETLTSLFEKRF